MFLSSMMLRGHCRPADQTRWLTGSETNPLQKAIAAADSAVEESKQLAAGQAKEIELLRMALVNARKQANEAALVVKGATADLKRALSPWHAGARPSAEGNSPILHSSHCCLIVASSRSGTCTYTSTHAHTLARSLVCTHAHAAQRNARKHTRNAKQQNAAQRSAA